MYEVRKKLERYLRVNLLGPSPRLIKKVFTGLRSHKSWETLLYNSVWEYLTPTARTEDCSVKQTYTNQEFANSGWILKQKQ